MDFQTRIISSKNIAVLQKLSVSRDNLKSAAHLMVDLDQHETALYSSMLKMIEHIDQYFFAIYNASEPILYRPVQCTDHHQTIHGTKDEE